MEILNQLGQLFLEAVPTVILVFLFYLFLRRAFFGPMERILNERSARIEGARREADAAQAAAQEKVKAYEDALRKARAEVYAEQDAARRAALDARMNLVKETRSKANETIRAAKDRIGRETAEARKVLERETESLGGEIARAILGGARSGPAAPREAR